MGTLVIDYQFLIIEFGVDTEPVFAIVRSDSAVIFPPIGVSRTTSIFDRIPAFDIFYVGGPKIKPLVKLGLIVIAYIKADMVILDVLKIFNVAAVEVAGNNHALTLLLLM